MKKMMSLILVVVLMVALGVGIMTAFVQSAEAAAAKGHLVWDSYDSVYRCVGTAVNCAFEN